MPGLDVLRRLRVEKLTQVLMLNARRGREQHLRD
jgi:DNA-binding response OmpR family regulator